MPLALVSAADLGPDAWDAFVDRSPDGWIWHTSDWRAYQAFCGRVDLSVAAVDGDRVVAIAPLLLSQDGDADPDGLPGPLYGSVQDVGESVRLFLRHAEEVGLKGWSMVDRPASALAPDHHYYGDVRVRTTRVVSLAGFTDAQLWAGLRRSYHSLIHRAEERYVVRILDAETNVNFAPVLAALHREAAGRETRPIETWQILAGLVRKRRAFVVLGTEYGPRGYVYVFAWKGWAYYGSAVALDRGGLAHALQWRALAHLAAMGVAHYEVGYLPEEPTEKERSIQVFKNGFGGDDWHARLYDVRFDAPPRQVAGMPGTREDDRGSIADPLEGARPPF